ncbi:hypothetical protein C0991_002496 [Blastosporella zonata]|nr:hypothetical protein C0991_002496 [Blastosporella zonata]
MYLGYCEGVVGRFLGTNVQFHSRLKKPIMAKRSSVSTSSASKSPTPRTRVSIDEHVLLRPSSPDHVPGVHRVKARLGSGTGSRRSSAGQERSDGELGYGSSRGASPTVPSPALRHSNLGSPSHHGNAATPPPPPRMSFASSKHGSVLSAYSQASEYDEEPKILADSVISHTTTIVVPAVPSPALRHSNLGSPLHAATPPPPPRVSFASSKHGSVLSAYSQASEYDDEPKIVADSVISHTTTTTIVVPTATTAPTTSMLPPSFSELSNSSLYASTSTSSTLFPKPISPPAPPPAPTPPPASPSPPPTALHSGLTNPDTSTSTYFDTSRISLALSDGEVGIGLSLLQDLADGEGWSGSDSDSASSVQVAQRRKGSVKGRGSLRRRGSGAPGSTSAGSGKNVRASTISEASRYSSEDGLGYEDTETGHSTHLLELEADITQTQAAFSFSQPHHMDLNSLHVESREMEEAESPVLGRSEHREHGEGPGQNMMTFPPVAPLSPSRSRYIPPQEQEERERDQEMEQFEFPTPPTHTPRMSISQSHRASVIGSMASSPPTSSVRLTSSTNSAASSVTNSPPSSFVRPGYIASNSTTTIAGQPYDDDPRTRRPSRVSTSSTAMSDNWDGDIYDDYRYSRFSTAGVRSFSSRVSVNSRVNGTGFGWESRPSVDSGSGGGSSSGSAGRQGSVDSQSQASQALPPQVPAAGRRTRSRSNTTASMNPVVLSPVLPSLTPGFVQSPPPAPPLPPPTQSPPVSPRLPASPRSPVSPRLPSRPPTQSPPTSPLLQQLSQPRASGIGHHTTDSESSGSAYSAPPSARLDVTFGSGSSVPPSPLGAGSNSMNSRPAPLQLASSNHAHASPVPSISALSPTVQYAQDLDHLHLQQQDNHQYQHRMQIQSIRSPLLHTGWGSPAPSSASTAQFVIVPPPTATTHSTPSTTSSDGQVMGNGFFPGGLDALGRSVAHNMHQGGDKDKEGSERDSGGDAAEGRRNVVEEEEEDRVVLGRGLVVREREKQIGGDENHEPYHEEHRDDSHEEKERITGDRALHESPSIASSPELSLKPPMVEDDDDDNEELEREKEELRRQAAGLTSPTLTPAAPTAPAATPHSPAAATPPYSTPPPISSPPPTTPSPIPAPASHLRPTLAEIRPSAERQSLFLPHPNAPKATGAAFSPGPMYIASQTQPPPPPFLPPNSRGAIQTIHMALRGQGVVQGPPGHARGWGATIYGITTTDLSAAMGPVLMHFSVNPPPATKPPPGSVPVRVKVTTTPTPPPPAVPPARAPSMGTPPPPPQSPVLAAPVPRIAVRRVGSVASIDVTPLERPGSGASGVIPRLNFFPKAGGVRPRSRSFSGFQSTTTEVPLPVQQSRDLEDQPGQMPTATEVKRSLSPIVGSPSTPTSNSSIKGPKPSPLRVSSPLSQNSTSTAVRPVRPPNSPLMQSFVTPFSQPPTSSSVPSSPTTTSPPRLLRQTASKSTLSDASTPAPRPSPRARTTLDSVGTPSPPAPHTPEPRGRPSADGDSSSVRSSRSNLISPPPDRHNSLRAKLSLPNLNLRRTVARQDSEPMSPLSPTAEADLLQVQDMDFELVRPSFGHLQGARSSEDSGVMGRDMSVDARQDGSFLRADSPLSIAPRSPDALGVWTPMKSSVRGGTDSEGASSSASMMDAHRQRELKWMAVLGSVQPSQSRKSKKVKKLIFDGVPSSVRYLVWSMLTDGKARCVPGVYAQLGGRGRVAALADVEKDVQRCFADHPQLLSTQGPVLSLLQAYLTMVPDVRYVTGLTLIVGHLLLLAPEEDAFWIFVSVMDSHIRPYFSLTSMQVDVDSTLFGRAMDTADPTLAKKLFGDLSVLPSAICRPWFTSLFVGSLPSDYLNRVWDIFLFEALGAVLRPAPELLPTSPEALITLALAVKFKDDDFRKQRVKLEAQAKRQTQAPRTAVSTSISLPRT